MSSIRTDIIEAVHRSWWTVDRDMGLGGELHFTPDGECVMPAITMRGRNEIARGYARRHDNGPRLSRHLISNTVVDIGTTDAASARYVITLFAGIGAAPLEADAPTAICDVEDRFRLVGGQWLIEQRELTAVFVAARSDSVMLRGGR
jgi:SnoaL-like domain